MTPERENEDPSGMSMPTHTPPPGPTPTRVTGTAQFAKPMKIQKKKFNMGPDPAEAYNKMGSAN